MPSVRFDPQSRIGFLGGYTGQGVAPSNLMGRMLAGIISGQATGLETLSVAQRKSPDWIPEPLRWLVVRYMQDALIRIDEATEGGKPKPVDATIAEFLGKH